MSVLLAAAVTFTPMPNGCLQAQLDLNDLAHETFSRSVRHAAVELLDVASRCNPKVSPLPDHQVSHPPASTPSGGVERWRGLVTQYFNPEDVDTALCLIGFESAGNPDAINPSSGARGLMQVMPSWAPQFNVKVDDLLNPDVNLSIAASLRYSLGWTQWAPYVRGECRG